MVRTRSTGDASKTEVWDKLRELHEQVEGGLRPRRRYTVEDALEDWLAVGSDGLSARTLTLYRGMIAKALREELGAVRLTDLTAAYVQKALTSMASRLSTRTVQIAHNVLVRAIRQAGHDDLVGRNVAGAGQALEGAAGRAAVEVAAPGAGGRANGRGPGDAAGGIHRPVVAVGSREAIALLAGHNQMATTEPVTGIRLFLP